MEKICTLGGSRGRRGPICRHLVLLGRSLVGDRRTQHDLPDVLADLAKTSTGEAVMEFARRCCRVTASLSRLCCILLVVGLAAGKLLFAQDPREKPILELNAGGHTNGAGIAFTVDGGTLVSVSKDKTIRVWDVATGETIRVLHPPMGRGGWARSMPLRSRRTAGSWR